MTDSKEFRALFESLPKDNTEKVELPEVFVAFRNVVGSDLLTRERFDSARSMRHHEKTSFSFEEFCQLFKDVDRYLETMPLAARGRRRSLTNGLRGIFRRKSKRDETYEDDKACTMRIPSICIKEPETPPLSQRVDHFERRLDVLESKMSEILAAHNSILSKLKYQGVFEVGYSTKRGRNGTFINVGNSNISYLCFLELDSVPIGRRLWLFNESWRSCCTIRPRWWSCRLAIRRQTSLDSNVMMHARVCSFKIVPECTSVAHGAVAHHPALACVYAEKTPGMNGV